MRTKVLLLVTVSLVGLVAILALGDLMTIDCDPGAIFVPADTIDAASDFSLDHLSDYGLEPILDH